MLLLLALLCRGVADAQSVQRARWWLDNEPQPVTALASFGSFDVPLQGLLPGLHTFSAMVQDSENRWSPAVSHYFVIMSPEAALARSFSKCQYWVDADFAGAKTSAMNGGNVASVDMDVKSLKPGLHAVSVRAQDDGGRWSPAVSHYFVIMSPEAALARSFSKCQYWVDADFAGAKTSAMNGGNVASVDMDVKSLKPGLHAVSVRAQDDGGRWSPVVSQFFVIMSPEAAAATHAAQCRYWIDGDNTGAVTTAMTGNALHVDKALSGLKPGIHTITCLVQDNMGRWSVSVTHFFVVLDSDVLREAMLVGYEYWFNSAPRIQVAMTPAQMLDMDNIVVPIENVVPNKIAGYRFDVPTLTALVPDDVLFGLQVVDDAGNLSGARIDTISMDVPVAVPLVQLRHRQPVTHAAPAAGTIQGYQVAHLGADCIVTVVVEGTDVKADFFDGQGNQLEATRTVQDGVTTYCLQPPAGNLYVLTYDAAGDASENTLEAIIDIHGDVNNDGEVSVADITLLVSIVMGGEVEDETRVRADVNLDGEISIADVTALVAIVMAQ